MMTKVTMMMMIERARIRTARLEFFVFASMEIMEPKRLPCWWNEEGFSTKKCDDHMHRQAGGQASSVLHRNSTGPRMRRYPSIFRYTDPPAFPRELLR